MANVTSKAHVGEYQPQELTAPVIQRLARKGLAETLSADERRHLCECVVFHIDAVLEERRIPKALKKPRQSLPGAG